ncbi:MAG: Omp28-related outer membrane protein [Bacteroidia bacterium]
MLEDEIISPRYTNTQGFAIDSQYVQNDMLRWLLTGLWGKKIEDTQEGSRSGKTFTYTVPHEFNIDNCYILVFVTRGKEEVLNCIKVKVVN